MKAVLLACRNRAWCLRALVVLVFLALAGCPAKQEAQDGGGAPAIGAPDSVPVVPEQPPPADVDQAEPVETQPGEEQAEAQDGGDDSAEAIQEAQEDSGGKLVLRATGRAKRSVDISLARDAAAERARAQLLKILKKKGYLDASSNRLEGATIERYFQRGRYIYAVAAIEVEPAVNQSGAPASKNSEEQGVQRQEPHGGTP